MQLSPRIFCLLHRRGGGPYIPKTRLFGQLDFYNDVHRREALFGVEPQNSWTPEEKKEFEEHASARLRACTSSALKAAAALSINIVMIIPFLAGHRFHSLWNFARYLLFTAMGLLLWFLLKAGYVWASWQSSRETREEFENAGSG